MPRYDLVLLDCDGTLYNTYPGVRANYENTLREMGLPEMPADYDWNRCIGPLLEYSLGTELGVPEDRIDEAKTIYRSTYGDIGIRGSILYDGMRECIDRLRKAGVKVGVASSKTQHNLEATIDKDGIRDLFSCIIGPQVNRRYTKAETILLASERLIMPMERILMVGDTHFDGQGAEEAGADFCAAAWGYGSPEEFGMHPCVFVAQTPSDVADYVLGLV